MGKKIWRNIIHKKNSIVRHQTISGFSQNRAANQIIIPNTFARCLSEEAFDIIWFVSVFPSFRLLFCTLSTSVYFILSQIWEVNFGTQRKFQRNRETNNKNIKRKHQQNFTSCLKCSRIFEEVCYDKC